MVLDGALAVAVAATGAVLGVPWAVETGIAVFVLGLAVIYVNGYLVPGTPTLTRRYLPARLLRLFGKADEGATISVDPEAELRSTGLVVDEGADLSLDPAFETAWSEAVDAIGRNDRVIAENIRSGLADLGGFDPDRLELVDGPHAFVAWYDDEVVANWESRAASLADVAAADVLPRFDPTWERRPLAVQAELLGALRLFVERCPTCGGDVTLGHRVVSSCCHDRDVVASSCAGCNARLFEIDVDPRALETLA
ncbi:hypothetical protein [Natronomonas sp.]|uniref:hypothetical protein n=1 Tax=Natronomonas sp. TaxID=2184060 RepID=UPI002FC3A8E5